MNKTHAFIFLFATVFFFSCGNNSESTPTKPASGETSTGAKQATVSESKQGDGIVGEWALTMVAPDENGNEVIDENEKAKATTSMKDYMKLNSDGSAEFYVFKAKGRYEINTNASSGKKYLNLFDKDNTKLPKGAILSVTKDELIIMNKFGGDSFTVWKRV